MIQIELVGSHGAKLSGRFDASQVERARTVFDQLEGDCVLDLDGLHYISSAGISAMLLLYKRLNAAGHTVRIRNASGHVRNIIDYAGLAQIFPLE
jgi:anti-anti-sigma factor